MVARVILRHPFEVFNFPLTLFILVDVKYGRPITKYVCLLRYVSITGTSKLWGQKKETDPKIGLDSLG